MNDLILAAIFLILALGGVVVRKTYYYLPLRELKRQAEKQDPLAQKLYHTVSYGNSLRSLLWLYIGLTTAASLVILARVLPVWASLLVVGPLLWVAFSLIPATRLTSFGARLTSFVTPVIAWILNYTHPILSRSADMVERRYLGPIHTKLFERDDLIDLIERQQQQNDSRIADDELEIAKRALSFSDYKVADILTARKKVKSVLAGDTIGPILIDEIHKAGQDYVLVHETKKGPTTGTLKVNMLSIYSEGSVSDIMSDKVYYLHESDSLSTALHAFYTTNQPVFLVVNNFEEFVGIVTVENLLDQLLGHVPGEDFDQYSDLQAVAARHIKKSEPAAEAIVETEVTPDEVR